MFDHKKDQDQSLEINQCKGVCENSSSSCSKNKNNQNPDSSKENCDSNRQYLISDNSQSAINPLTKSREDLITSNNNLKNNNLFSAVECNDLEKVSELLNQDNSKINELNDEGLSLLHIAVIKANIKMINLLLKYGADSNILSDKKKQTPLHLAYLNQNSMTEEIIKELIKNKANENIYDSKNKKPSDYMGSSYKKNKNKKYNENNSENIISNSDKKSYTNNNTGNTVTIVTIDNHLDSFLTTNKEEENKSNINNINTNSNNNTIVQSPTKLDVDYDLNEIISINNSVEKSNSQLNQKINNSEDNIKNRDKEGKRRQYTFGKEDDFMKFQGKNSEKNNEENKNNITKNSTFDNLDINNNYYFESVKNEENKKEEKNISNNSIKEEDYNKTIKENEILNDSLEDKNEMNEDEEEEKEERDNCDQLYDSLKNNNILLNKDNIISQNSFNINNNSLTYTDSLNANGSCFQSKNKITNINNKTGSNNNTNENDDNENDKKITLKPPLSDNKINFDITKTNEEEKLTINDDFLTKIITKKRNSFSHSSKDKSKAYKNSIINNTARNSLYNKTAFNLENENFNNSMRSNRTTRANYLSPSYINNKIMGENEYTINTNPNKQKKRDSYNNMIYQNNSYKNNITIVHNGTDSRFGISGNLTQYSTQSQKRKNNLFSTDKIKVIMNDNSQNNPTKITEFNYIDNIHNLENDTENEKNIYKNESNLGNMDNNISISISYLKYWLNNLGLLDYLNNFIKINAYDINDLIERMKSYQTKLRFEDLESALKIRVPGYIYRILCKLEADAGLIDPKIVKFMIREGINDGNLKNINMMKSINNKSDKNMNISISQSYYQCLNCCKMNQIKKQKKNDLKYFLIRYNLVHLYQNFHHNGFDMIEYVIIQMYSSFPINEDILENCFHIYDENQRRITLKAIVAEMKKINKFLNSEEYNNSDKNTIKYDNIIFEDDLNKDKSKIALKDDGNNLMDNCQIF